MSSENKPKSTVDNVSNNNLHVVFLPFVAPSHMIPLVLVARLFAARGVFSTIITTIHNALLFQKSIDEDISRNFPIVVHTLEFPASEVGLPVGAENPSVTTSHELVLAGVEILQPKMEQLIRDIAPNCIISDMFFPWTTKLAHQLNIPRLVFYPNAVFNNCIEHNLKLLHVRSVDDSETFVVPNLPHKITMKSSQVMHQPAPDSKIHELGKNIEQAEKQSYGLVFNTFYELEPAYVDHVKKIKDKKVWHLGPLFQFVNNNVDTTNITTTTDSCLRWLDKQKPNSVIYICFGTLANFQEAQITEIALALEECNQPFVWVLRKRPGDEKEGLGGLPEGYIERIENKDKGLVITDWAPQVKILQHASIGWFLNHCGWNSVLEAVVAGVPILTWPLFSDQFNHECLLHLLGIGLGIGADVGNPGIDITSPIVKKQQIIEAIGKLTSEDDGESKISETMRSSLKELSMKAKQAVQKGGSSFNSLTQLIEEIKAFK